MGGASSSGSVLANAAKRRDQLNAARRGLLDRPGLPPKSKAQAPAQVPAPAQSAKQKALEDREPVQAPAAGPSTANPAEESRRIENNRLEPSPLNLDEATRSEMKEMVEPFLEEQRRKQRVRLHKVIGRARRFFGGGF